MTGWRPYDPSANAAREILEQYVHERQRSGSAVPMPMNAYEDADGLVLEASMPGVRPDDVELSCTDQVLTIRGRCQVAERDYLHQEIRTVEYLRRVPLPADCRFERARADADHGVVTIRIPKARPKPPEKIRIQVARKG